MLVIAWFFLACLAALVVGAAWLFRTLKRLTPEGMDIWEFAAKSGESGYLPPPPNATGVRLYWKFCRLMVKLQIGRYTVVNPEYLKVDGAAIYSSNHSHYTDPMLFPLAVGKNFRHMGSRKVFKFVGGLSGVFSAGLGGFPVDQRPGKGAGAAEAAVKVLVTGQPIVIFPEGTVWVSGVDGPRPFRKGIVRIAKEASAKLGKPVYIVPAYIRYNRYPGEWIEQWPSWKTFLFLLLCAPVYRRGATIVAGKPLSSADLPEDDDEAIELVRNTIIALDPAQRAKASCCK